MKNGRVIHEQSRTKGQTGFIVGAPVRVGDQDMVGVALIRRDVNTQRMFVQEVFLKENLRAPIKTGAAAEAVRRTGGKPGGIFNIVREIMLVNESSIKAQLDENGEPLASEVDSFLGRDDDSDSDNAPEVLGSSVSSSDQESDQEETLKPTPELNADQLIPIIKAKSEPFNSSKEARRWAKENIKGDYKNKMTGWVINVANSGIDHATSGNKRLDPDFLKSIRNVPELIENAVLVESRPSKKSSGIRAIHRFYAALEVNGKFHRAKITVRESQKGKLFYDQALTKIERAGALLKGGGQDLQGDNSRAAKRTSAQSNISIGQLLENVKKDDGSPALHDDDAASPEILGDSIETSDKAGIESTLPGLKKIEALPESVLPGKKTFGEEDAALGRSKPGIDRQGGTALVYSPPQDTPEVLGTKLGSVLKRVNETILKGKARPDAVRNLIRKRLGVPVNEGGFRINMGNSVRLGQFKVKPQTIQLANKNSIDTLAHEVGHHFSEVNKPIRKLYKRHKKEILRLTPAAYANQPESLRMEEGFAEFFRLYFTQRKTA